MPWGLESGDPSDASGAPPPSEKRTVTGIGWPLNSFARLSLRASAELLKLPSTTTPLAWTARNPGCTPYSLFIASTICADTGTSSAVTETAAISVSSDARDVAICFLVMCSPLRVASAGLHQFHNRLRRIDRPPSAAMRKTRTQSQQEYGAESIERWYRSIPGYRSQSCHGSRRTPWPGLVAHQRHTCLPSACEYAVTETRMPYSPPALPMNTMRFQACGAIVSLNPAFGSPTVVCHTTSPVPASSAYSNPSSVATNTFHRPPRHPVVGTATKGGEAELRLEFPLRRASSRIQRDHRVIDARGDVHRAADHDLRQMLRVLRHPSGAIADVEPAGATCGRVT